jgi:hypothetical protein
MVYSGATAVPFPGITEINPRFTKPSRAFTTFCFVVFNSMQIIEVGHLIGIFHLRMFAR